VPHVCAGRCGIYADRPQFCRDYPRLGDTMAPGCTYHFVGEERRGECRPEVCQEGCCCNYPREGGEPTGRSLDEALGGQPCRFLVWEEREEPEKVAEADSPSATSEIYDAVVGSILEAP